MTLEEHTDLIRNIRTNLNDEGTVSELLAQLSDGFNTTVAQMHEIESKNSDLTKANESLREANMKLFLRVGTKVDGANTDGSAPENKEDKLEFKNLFNEKGELK